MKKLIAILISVSFLWLPLEARRRWIPKISAVAGGNITAGLWSPMETATPTAANLKTASSGTLVAGATYTTSGTAITSNASAQQALVSTVNSTSTTGSFGVIGDHNSVGWFRIELASATATQSNVCAYQCTTLSSGTHTVPLAWGESSAAADYIASVRIDNTAGVYAIKLINSGGSSSTITISPATFYIITTKIVSGSTCSMNVYTTAGVQVGTTVTLAGIAKSFFYQFVGCLDSDSATGLDYIDNYCIDTATATFPLGP